MEGGVAETAYTVLVFESGPAVGGRVLTVATVSSECARKK